MLLWPAGASAHSPLTVGPQENEPAEELTVAVKTIEPFVFVEGTRVTGFSIELWDEIANRIGFDYGLVTMETVQEQLASVRQGDVDVAMAGISISAEREEYLDFSHPYFITGLQIMVLTEAAAVGNLRTVFEAIFSPTVVRIIILFFALILLVAHVIWLVDRHRNADFPANYVIGIWEAIWWASVTVTTVGYGDKTPKTSLGRVIGLAWMFAGLFLIANFTATITAELAIRRLESQIDTVHDLDESTVATVAGSAAAAYLRGHDIDIVERMSIDEAFTLLLDGEVDAIVYDAPPLLHLQNTTGAGRVEVLPTVLTNEYYGIALPAGSPHREVINHALLSTIEDGTYDRIYARWFGN